MFETLDSGGSRWSDGHNWSRGAPQKQDEFPVDACLGFSVLLALAVLVGWLRQRLAAWREVRRSPEFAARRRLEREEAVRAERVGAARGKVLRYYRAHRELLDDVLPHELFEATINVRFPPDVSPDQAWRAANDLLAELTPLVRERAARRETQRRRLQGIDGQIRGVERRISTLQRSNRDDMFSGEIDHERARLERLLEERGRIEAGEE